MKKLILLSSLFFTHLVFMQTWDGSLLPTGNTYRTGNVGIGTNNPLFTLNVPAYYVFETYHNGFSDLKPDYVMPTLKEVEVFTKANNHLPNVPSAKETQENGLQLKEMTLYTIEQDKQLKQQQEQINELKK